MATINSYNHRILPALCLLASPELLRWVVLPRNGQIAPHGGFGLLGVAVATDHPAQINDERCGEVQGPTLLTTWANTNEFWDMGGWQRLQDAFCQGDWTIQLTVYSDTSFPVGKRFILKVKPEWQDLEMVEDKWQSQSTQVKQRNRFVRALKYIIPAFFIVVANWVVGNIGIVNNLLVSTIWPRVVMGVVFASVPLALISRGKKGRRFLVAYTGLLIAALVFLVGKVNDTITAVIPALVSPDLVNLALAVFFVLVLSFLLWLIDYLRAVPKDIETQLAQKSSGS